MAYANKQWGGALELEPSPKLIFIVVGVDCWCVTFWKQNGKKQSNLFQLTLDWLISSINTKLRFKRSTTNERPDIDREVYSSSRLSLKAKDLIFPLLTQGLVVTDVYDYISVRFTRTMWRLHLNVCRLPVYDDKKWVQTKTLCFLFKRKTIRFKSHRLFGVLRKWIQVFDVYYLRTQGLHGEIGLTFEIRELYTERI